jgi:hypothetical protein
MDLGGAPTSALSEIHLKGRNDPLGGSCGDELPRVDWDRPQAPCGVEHQFAGWAVDRDQQTRGVRKLGHSVGRSQS